jgi:ligand-binding SRPBCC domain-containing protein
MRTVVVSTHLDAPPERVWELLQQPSTLVHVAAGLLRFSGASELPARWEEGAQFSTRLWVAGIIPLPWRHHIRLVGIDGERLRIESEESGGPVRTWNHRILVSAEDHGTRYVDEVDIEAGWLTGVVALTARVLYRYRQARWRRLARSVPEPA